MIYAISSFYLSDERLNENIPAAYELMIAYPNPFNFWIQIDYKVNINLNQIKISIYNVIGQHVKVLVDKIQSRGVYSIQWDGSNPVGQLLPSGIYFCKIQSNNTIAKTLKLILLR